MFATFSAFSISFLSVISLATAYNKPFFTSGDTDQESHLIDPSLQMYRFSNLMEEAPVCSLTTSFLVISRSSGCVNSKKFLPNNSSSEYPKILLTAGFTFINLSIDEIIIISTDTIKSLSAAFDDSSSFFLSEISVKIPPIA